MPPKVSVIVPAYNAAAFLAQTLTSVLRQTFADFELLVVDDGSSDQTMTVVEQFAQADSRVKFLFLPGNSNLPAVPRNSGAEEAHGRYLAWLDHDDIWFRRKLERQLRVLEANPQVALVHAAMLPFPWLHVIPGAIRLPDPRRQSVLSTELRQYNRIQCSSVVIRADAFRSCGGFDTNPSLRAVEDYHLWLRMAKAGYQMRYVSEIMGLYRIAATSTAGRENMPARVANLEDMGLRDAPQKKRVLERVPKRLAGLPRAYSAHLVGGLLRTQLGLAPRTY